ncbi:MAG: flagellar motor protein MotB [Planctomycetota bacterium]
MAIARKAEKAEAGAPAWMVTYGDMVTLLLTFFVLLLAMSEVKKEEQFLEFMQAIREAFGYVGGAQQTPIEEVDVPLNVALSEMLIIPIHSENFSKVPDPGVRGKQPAARDNRPGEIFVVGGRLCFPSLSALLTEQEAARIPQLATELRGHNTLIEITGHCSRKPLAGTSFNSHFDLAYQRALAVAEVLIDHGINPQRLILRAAGSNEPVEAHTYTEEDLSRNDLVEIYQVDVRIAEPRP